MRRKGEWKRKQTEGRFRWMRGWRKTRCRNRNRTRSMEPHRGCPQSAAGEKTKTLASVRLLAHKRASIETGQLMGKGDDNIATYGESLRPSSYEPSQLAHRVHFIDGLVSCPPIKPGAGYVNDRGGNVGELSDSGQSRGSGRLPDPGGPKTFPL